MQLITSFASMLFLVISILFDVPFIFVSLCVPFVLFFLSPFPIVTSSFQFLIGVSLSLCCASSQHPLLKDTSLLLASSRPVMVARCQRIPLDRDQTSSFQGIITLYFQLSNYTSKNITNIGYL